MFLGYLTAGCLACLTVYLGGISVKQDSPYDNIGDTMMTVSKRLGLLFMLAWVLDVIDIFTKL